MAARSTAAQGTIATPPGSSPTPGRFTITTTTTTDHTVNEEDIRRKRARPPETTTTTNPFTVRRLQCVRSVHAMASSMTLMVLVNSNSVSHIPAYCQQVLSVSLPPTTKLRQGNVFTPSVILFTGVSVLACTTAHMTGGGLCPGESLSRRISVWGSLSWETPADRDPPPPG